jgi:ATP-binding cassette subfamily F protein 3
LVQTVLVKTNVSPYDHEEALSIVGEVRWEPKSRSVTTHKQLDDLDDRNEIIMELRRVAPSTATAGELRSFLAKFLFTGVDVYKHVRDLSGGERGD